METNKYSDDFEIFWVELSTILKSVVSTPKIFNQYRDYNEVVDLPEAANIRLNNLYNYMYAAAKTAKYLILGEAAGPWGCRFSGIPFTGEKQIIDPNFPYKGLPSSKTFPEINIKNKTPFISNSAKIFWEIMLPFHDKFIVWDVFPLHPHKENDILSVRTPSKEEVNLFKNALILIINYIKPAEIISIGRIASEQLKSIGIKSIYVRHPSMGGKKSFSFGINEIFNN